MAGRKVIWSPQAKIDLFEILDFYYQRNGNKIYSRKLHSQLKKSVRMIQKFPKLGLKTDELNVRAIIEGHYTLFYKLTESHIEILIIWDNRQNPEKLDLKK
jgi:plasmid stabilization system protein ParE